MRAAILACVVLMLDGCSAPQAPPPPTPVAKPPPAVAAPAPAPVPEGEDFEAAPAGSLPPGWKVVDGAKDIAFTAAPGDAGTVLKIVTTGEGGGSIKRPVDVARYRGKRVLLSARGSCESSMWWARGLVGVDVARPGARGQGDRVRTERIDKAPWREHRAIVDVAADATGLALVVSAAGPSTVRIDDITLTVLGNAGAGDEPPRALEGRGLDNVLAFARLYGIVRYFHPSDEAAALDDAAWQRFVVRGVREVEAAADAAALEARLAALFAPIAPTVAIRAGREAAPAAPAVTGPAVHWTHHGIGISPQSVYRSFRGADTRRIATITTKIDPAAVRGKQLKVTLRARGTLDGPLADAGLWISEQAGGKAGFYTEPEMQPAVGASWTEIPVESAISADAASLTLGVQVMGTSDVWLELPVVTADGKPVAVAAWGAGRALSSKWSNEGTGLDVAIGGTGCEKRPCLHVSPTPTPPVDVHPWTGALAGGVAAMVPLELPTRDGKTVPAATASSPAADPMPLVASDRATRLAAVIIAWNVFEHFYPYFDVRGTDWMPELPRRLGEAAVADGPRALHATLRRLVHELHDGHGSVSSPAEDLSRLAPWLWERVEGKLVITQVAEQCACDLAPGDVVTAIDGVPTEQVIAAARALDSAATEQFSTSVVLRMLRAGPEDGRRKLAIERAGATREVEVALVASTAAPSEKRPTSGDEIAPGIRYVDIDKITAEQWQKVLPALAAAKGVIIDVRGYPGRMSLSIPLAHATKRQLRSAQWHIPMPVRPDREAMAFDRSDWAIEPMAPLLPNVVFLTDGRAVSAAETFMGIVEHFKLGPIVGAATAGTNGNINPFSLPGGYSVNWTGMKVLKHDGSRHHGIGILPTVPAQRTIAGVAAGRDEVLERGIEVARQRAKPGRR